MITELNFAKLTPASFALANANDVDAGVGRSMLLNNIRHGREVAQHHDGARPGVSARLGGPQAPV